MTPGAEIFAVVLLAGIPWGIAQPATRWHHHLEELGLLTSEWKPVAGRRRRLYRVTPEGIAALRTEHNGWRALVSAMELVLRPGTAAAS